MDQPRVLIFQDDNQIRKICIKNDIDLSKFKYFNFESYLKVFKDSSYPYVYFTLWYNESLIGVIKMISLYDYQNIGSYFRLLSYITINSNYKNMGYSKILLSKYFNFLNINEIKNLTISAYSKDGWNFLKNNIQKYASLNNVIIKQSDYIFNAD